MRAQGKSIDVSVEKPNNDAGVPNTSQTGIETRTEIVSFLDTSILSESMPQNEQLVPEPMKMNPYSPVNETIEQWVQRAVSDTFTWNMTDPRGANICELAFPNFIFSSPMIWPKLQHFRYFKAGVRVGIRINGSPFHMGLLMVSWSPQGNNTGILSSGTNNIYSASGNPSYYFSPSENETHYFSIPWSLPFQYLELGKDTSTFFDMGNLHVYVVNPLVNTGSSLNNVTFTIFANFEDVEVAGYYHDDLTIPTRLLNNQTSNPAILPSQPVNPVSSNKKMLYKRTPTGKAFNRLPLTSGEDHFIIHRDTDFEVINHGSVSGRRTPGNIGTPSIQRR